MSEVVFHRLDREAVLRALGAWAREELAAQPEVREVRLIGSLTRTDWSARSDADVVVLVEPGAPAGPREAPRYLPRRRFPVAVDVIVLPVDQGPASQRLRAEIAAGVPLLQRR